MRNLLLFATIGAAAFLGATGVYALPASSPYATWEPQSIDQGLTPMSEGRAAFVQGDAENYSYAPSIPTPEDRTYYSRGK